MDVYNTENDNDDSSDISVLREQIKSSLSFIEATLDPTRIRIIGALFVYQKLSNEELCQIIGKSWPTIDRHTKILAKAAVILVEEVEARGPNKKRLFTINPSYFDQIDWFHTPTLLKMETDELITYFEKRVHLDTFYSKFFQIWINDILDYSNRFTTQLKLQYKHTNEEIIDFFFKKTSRSILLALDDTEQALLDTKLSEFYQELYEHRRILTKKNEMTKEPRKYAAFIAKWSNAELYKNIKKK